MLHFEDMTAIVAECSFNDWQLAVGGVDLHLYLQVQFTGPCNHGGEPQTWHGRKWMLSPHMCRSEVIATAFKAVLTAVEHEAREQFLYRGRAIYNGHIDADALWAAAVIEDKRT